MKKIFVVALLGCLALSTMDLGARCLNDKHAKARNKKKTYVCKIKKKNKKRFKAGKCKLCGCAAKDHDNK